MEHRIHVAEPSWWDLRFKMMTVLRNLKWQTIKKQNALQYLDVNWYSRILHYTYISFSTFYLKILGSINMLIFTQKGRIIYLYTCTKLFQWYRTMKLEWHSSLCQNPNTLEKDIIRNGDFKKREKHGRPSTSAFSNWKFRQNKHRKYRFLLNDLISKLLFPNKELWKWRIWKI